MRVTVLDPMGDRPLFRQLADLLRDRIHSGELKPGDQLPTQKELTAQHDVSTSVVREAVDVLRGEGLVETFQGRGTLVRTPPPRRRLSSQRYADQLARSATGESAFAVDHDARLADTSIDCAFAEAPATGLVADLLGIDPGAAAYRRHMVWRVDGLAKRITRSWFPLDLVAGTPMTDPFRQPWPGGVIAELADLGLAITSVDEDVIARMPVPDEAYTLRIPGGTPVFVVQRVGRARRVDSPASVPRVVEVAELTLPCDRYGLHYRLDF